LPDEPTLTSSQTSHRQPQKCSVCKQVGHNARNCYTNGKRTLASTTSSNLQSTNNQRKSQKLTRSGKPRSDQQNHGDTSNDEDEIDGDDGDDALDGFVDPQAEDELEVQAQSDEQTRLTWIDHPIQPIPNTLPTRDCPAKPVEISTLYPAFKGSTKG